MSGTASSRRASRSVTQTQQPQFLPSRFSRRFGGFVGRRFGAAWAGAAVLLACASVQSEPVRVDPSNPHYFLVNGKTTPLIGASYISYRWWANQNADYGQMLAVSSQNRLNVFRVWHLSSRSRTADRDGSFPGIEAPTAGAADGQNKFDLNSWNGNYFARLKDLIQQAANRGIIVELTFFTMCYSDADWKVHPLKAANNIQGIGTSTYSNFLTIKDLGLLARQLALVRKTMVELNGFDNVIYELANEPYFTEDVLGSTFTPRLGMTPCFGKRSAQKQACPRNT